MTPLKRKLREQGRNTVWLTRQLGVSETTGYNWTGGKTHPSDDRKSKISKLLGVSIEELFFSDEEATRAEKETDETDEAA